jgi:hypothetical protein
MIERMIRTLTAATRTGDQLVPISLPLVPFLLDEEHPAKYTIAEHPPAPKPERLPRPGRR